MYSQSDIESAIAAGALAPEQAAGLRDHVAARNGVPTADEEYLRYTLGFNDMFVNVACFLALITVGWLGALIPIGGGRGLGSSFSVPILAPIFVAGAAWGLAEIFTRLRHLALASITLSFVFALAVLFTLIAVIVSSMTRPPDGIGGAVIGFVCLGLTAGAAYLHWWRFRVPVDMGLAAGFAALAVVALIGGALSGMDGGSTVAQIVTLLTGIGVFVYAMRWDSRDLLRHTDRSEVAFWLHAAAALLIVLPLMSLFGLSFGVGSIGSAIALLLIYVLCAVVALIADRRFILLVGLIPLGTAIANLVRSDSGARYGRAYDAYGSSYGRGGYGGRSSMAPDMMFGSLTTLLIISVILLLLAIFWTPLRRALVGILPAGLRARVPGTDRTGHIEARRFE